MPCALTQGFTLDCRDSSGGVKSIWLMEIGNVSGITASNGVISVIGKVAGKRFWKYQQIKETSEAKEELQANEQNGTNFWNQSLDIVINKLQAATRNEIVLLAENYLVVVIQDRNDKYWYYGETNGMILGPGTAGTGKALGDRNGYALTLVGKEPNLAQEVSSAVISGLETAS